MGTMSRITAALAALAAAALTLSAPATANDTWTHRADAAINDTIARDNGHEAAFTYAMLTGAIAEVHGWDDPRVKPLLNQIYRQRLASGGYGLPYAWDAFQDGSTNPATTTYAITVSGQVGRVLLDGYEAGAVPRAEIERLVTVMLNMPRINDGKPGICMSYSSRGSDAQPGKCVPNIVASAGLFLTDARDAGVNLPGQDALIAGLTQRDAFMYRTGTGFWPYMDGAPHLNDWNHNAVNVEAELTLSPGIGREALAKMMALDTPAVWVDPLGLIALLPYDCTRSTDLAGDFDALFTDSRQSAALMAQMAYWSARAATHC